MDVYAERNPFPFNSDICLKHYFLCTGADLHAMDLVHGKGLKDWVLKTGRFDTLVRLRRLQTRPVAEQFCENFVPEWPELKHLVARATAPKSTTQKLRQRLRDSLSFSFPHDPQDNGVLDQMVRLTTSIHSPLVAVGCHPLRPTSPPEIGKRRLAVPELLAKHTMKELEESTVSHRSRKCIYAKQMDCFTGSYSGMMGNMTTKDGN
uniref:Ankyrin repeat domain 33Aa n=1 Tax=Neogobius melanostomus TaxID=47308 RepID=A0A8C6WJV1_9GOBI